MRTVREPAFREFQERLDRILPGWPKIVAPLWLREVQVHNHKRAIGVRPKVLVSDMDFDVYASSRDPTRFLMLNRLLDRICLALTYGATPDEIVLAIGARTTTTAGQERRNPVVSIPLADLLRL